MGGWFKVGYKPRLPLATVVRREGAWTCYHQAAGPSLWALAATHQAKRPPAVDVRSLVGHCLYSFFPNSRFPIPLGESLCGGKPGHPFDHDDDNNSRTIASAGLFLDFQPIETSFISPMSLDGSSLQLHICLPSNSRGWCRHNPPRPGPEDFVIFATHRSGIKTKRTVRT